MPVLVKDLEIVPDPWKLIDSPGACDPESVEGCILPFDYWAAEMHAAGGANVRSPRSPGVGFWVDGEVEVERIGPHLEGASVVAVKFPAFADGRGLSLGVLLRSRCGFRGELRAFGDILPDLAQYLHRSGFDAFVVEGHRAAEVAIASVGSITDHYQASVLQAQPAFRRIRSGQLNPSG